jgi:tetratricopeptide (TPR) repeat protein
MDYSRICFVIMPFGVKDVGGKSVDFDRVYEDIFKVAINLVALPEGGHLDPHRTDKDFFAGDIKLDMFRYLEYSRFALADISGLNFNVAYELGARHRVRESGTAIFRQQDAPIPFDISSIKAFPYEYQPENNAAAARALIQRVLTESLAQNTLDSPVRIALAVQQAQGEVVERMLHQAENAIRSEDWNAAMGIFRDLVQRAPEQVLPRVRLGLLYRDRGMWSQALEQLQAATRMSSTYGEAFRELGIVENKLAQQKREPMDTNPAPGEASLRQAIALNETDFDALASLGGVLKRANRRQEALDAYARATQVSGGHPYPLLNELKLRANLSGRLTIEPRDKVALMRAERVREGQAKQDPPYDKPWCFFDLAEIRLYLGKKESFLELLQTGAAATDHNWQIETCLSSLRMLEPAAADLPGLSEGIALLQGMVA